MTMAKRLDPAAMTDHNLEPPSGFFSFRTKPNTVCACSPARVPTFTALPKASPFSFAPLTPPSATSLAFRHSEVVASPSKAAVKPSISSACYPSTPSIAADLMCYEVLVSIPAESQWLTHHSTG